MLTKWLPRWVFAGLCLSAFVCSAQTAQPLFQPHVTFVNNSGEPCAGCKLWSWSAGTTTPQPTYTDASEATQNQNPVVLDASGSAAVWMGSSAYKFALIDTYGTTLWTVDNVLAPSPGGTGLYLPLAGGTMTGNIAMGSHNLTNVGAIGIGTTSPAWPLDVENGAINSSGGYLYNGVAPLNHILLGNGGFYVDSASFPWASLSGKPTFYYQTVASNAIAQTQRPTLNFSSRFAVTDSVSPAQTNVDLPASPVTPGSYTCVNATVDTYGRVTAMSTGLCPTGITQYATTAGGCTTSSSSYSVCTMSVTWPVSFADTTYTAGCTPYNPTDGGNPTSGRAGTNGITAKSTTGVTLQVSTNGGSAITFTGMDCWAHHN